MKIKTRRVCKLAISAMLFILTKQPNIIFFIINFSRALFFTTISHNRQITSYYYFPLKKNFEKKMKKKSTWPSKKPIIYMYINFRQTKNSENMICQTY